MDMKEHSVSWTKHMKDSFFAAPHTTRQHQCIQTTSQNHSLKLDSSTSQNTLLLLPMLPSAFVVFFLLVTSISPVLSHPIASDSVLSHSNATQTFRPGVELHKLRRIRALLRKINKPAIKTIKAFSPACFRSCYRQWQCVHFLFFFFLTWFFVLLLAESRWGFDRLCFISSATSFWPSWTQRKKTIGR